MNYCLHVSVIKHKTEDRETHKKAAADGKKRSISDVRGFYASLITKDFFIQVLKTVLMKLLLLLVCSVNCEAIKLRDYVYIYPLFGLLRRKYKIYGSVQQIID